jgi:hypothetical protein
MAHHGWGRRCGLVTVYNHTDTETIHIIMYILV